MARQELTPQDLHQRIGNQNLFPGNVVYDRRGLLSAQPGLTISPMGNIRLPNASDSYSSPKLAYMASALSLENINILRGNPNASLLSVGAGPAFFEQWLTDPSVGIDIDPSQIQLADRDAQFLPPGFNHHIFDMDGPWPSFSRKFDIIMFNGAFPTMTTANFSRLKHIIEQARQILASDGEIRMTDLGSNLNQVISQLQQVMPDLDFMANAPLGFLLVKERPIPQNP